MWFGISFGGSIVYWKVSFFDLLLVGEEHGPKPRSVVTEVTDVGDSWLPSDTLELDMLHDLRSPDSRSSTFWSISGSFEVYFACFAMKITGKELLDCDAHIIFTPTGTWELRLTCSLGDLSVILLRQFSASSFLLSVQWNPTTIGQVFDTGIRWCSCRHVLSKFFCGGPDSLLSSKTPSSLVCTEWKKSGFYTNIMKRSRGLHW